MNERIDPLDDISSVLDSIFGTDIEVPAEPPDEMLDTLKAIQVHLSLIDKRLSDIESLLSSKVEEGAVDSKRVITPETVKVDDLKKILEKDPEYYTDEDISTISAFLVKLASDGKDSKNKTDTQEVVKFVKLYSDFINSHGLFKFVDLYKKVLNKDVFNLIIKDAVRYMSLKIFDTETQTNTLNSEFKPRTTDLERKVF